MLLNGKSLFSSLLVAVFMLSSFIVDASLLISPTRLAFGDRDRSAKVTLINSGSKTQTYRVEWREYRASQTGQYSTLEGEELAGFPTASDYMRVSPRQVTLAPGERQTVKVIARRPRDLADGEYRSHLQFTALPPKDSAAQDNGGMSIKLNLLLSYNIPVMLRKGPEDVELAFDSVKLETPTGDRSKTHIAVNLTRDGIHSATGRLLAYWRDKSSSEEKQVGVLNGLNVFTDTANRTAKILWQGTPPNSQGYLRVVYEGQEEYAKQIMAETVVEMDLNTI